MELVVEQYNHALAQWERQTSNSKHRSLPKKKVSEKNSGNFSSSASKSTLERSYLIKIGELDKKPPCMAKTIHGGLHIILYFKIV